MLVTLELSIQECGRKPKLYEMKSKYIHNVQFSFTMTLNKKLQITAWDTKIFHFGENLCCSQLIKHLWRWRGIHRTTCTLKTAFSQYFWFHNITWHCLTESNSIYIMCYYQLIPYEVIRNLSARHATRTADDLHLCRNLRGNKVKWNVNWDSDEFALH